MSLMSWCVSRPARPPKLIDGEISVKAEIAIATSTIAFVLAPEPGRRLHRRRLDDTGWGRQTSAPPRTESSVAL
jgi:hypothetical protein